MAEPLPLYVQDHLPQTPFEVLLTRITVPISTPCPDARTILESFIESQKAPAYDYDDSDQSTSHPSPDPIDHYPLVEKGHITNDLTLVQQQIVNELFNAVQREDAESITLLIQLNLVSPNTTSQTGQTPLVEAVSKKNITIVKQLLDFGADCNKFSAPLYGPQADATRTPLMLAASTGSLPIVKLLFEPPHSANDALIASDGQIALRLAAENDHRSIVDYLPSRRAGGFLRFRTHHARSIARIKTALGHIAAYITFFVWYLPKFFVWDVPKYVLVLPLARGCKWCWANRMGFGPWCKRQLTGMLNGIVDFGKAAWKATKGFPKAVWKAIKEAPGVIWQAIKGVAEAFWEMGKALWELLTVGIPNAIGIALRWVWDGISSLARAIGDIFLGLISFLHTILEATVSFLRNVTLKDIWNAFCDLLRAVFITLPRTLWSWVWSFGEASYRFMKALMGELGQILWWIVTLVNYVVVYIPVKLGVIVVSVGSSVVKAFAEVRVWISPKA